MIITPAMELLIQFVAREAGVDAAHTPRGREHAQGKRAHAKTAKVAAGKARKAV